MDSADAAALLLAAALVVGAAGTVATTGGASTYDIDVTGATDVPDRTVTHEGQQFVIGEIELVGPGDSLSADTTVPDDQFHGLNVYDEDGGSALLTSGENGPSTHTYSADEMDEIGAGTYALGLVQDQELRDVYLFVVEGYDVDLSVPAEVAEDESATATIDVDPTRESGAPDEVRLAIDDDGDDVSVTAIEVEDGVYEADVPADELGPGSYDVHGIVFGPGSAFGESEILGLTPGSAVQVTEAEEEEAVTVDTGAATNVTDDSATLSGDLQELVGADEATVAIEYGTDAEDLSSTASAGSLSSTGSFEVTVDDLDPDTEYAFRAVAETDDAADAGSVATFSTDSTEDDEDENGDDRRGNGGEGEDDEADDDDAADDEPGDDGAEDDSASDGTDDDGSDEDGSDDGAEDADESADDDGDDSVQQPTVDDSDDSDDADDAADDEIPLSPIVPLVSILLASVIALRRVRSVE